jgi:hypothetical protein
VRGEELVAGLWILDFVLCFSAEGGEELGAGFWILDFELWFSAEGGGGFDEGMLINPCHFE